MRYLQQQTPSDGSGSPASSPVISSSYVGIVVAVAVLAVIGLGGFAVYRVRYVLNFERRLLEERLREQQRQRERQRDEEQLQIMKDYHVKGKIFKYHVHPIHKGKFKIKIVISEIDTSSVTVDFHIYEYSGKSLKCVKHLQSQLKRVSCKECNDTKLHEHQGAEGEIRESLYSVDQLPPKSGRQIGINQDMRVYSTDLQSMASTKENNQATANLQENNIPIEQKSKKESSVGKNQEVQEQQKNDEEVIVNMQQSLISFNSTESSTTRDAPEDECTICLEIFQEGDIVIQSVCSHRYHLACLEDWFHRGNFTCPICRHELEFDQLKKHLTSIAQSVHGDSSQEQDLTNVGAYSVSVYGASHHEQGSVPQNTTMPRQSSSLASLEEGTSNQLSQQNVRQFSSINEANPSQRDAVIQYLQNQ